MKFVIKIQLVRFFKLVTLGIINWQVPQGKIAEDGEVDNQSYRQSSIILLHCQAELKYLDGSQFELHINRAVGLLFVSLALAWLLCL